MAASRILPVLAILLVTCFSAGPTRPESYREHGEQILNAIQTAQELQKVLTSRDPPSTVSLAPRFQGGLELRNIRFDPPVTIRSADSEAPATLTGLYLNNVTGLSFELIRFHSDIPATDDRLHRQPFRIFNSSAIAIRNSSILGRDPATSGILPLGQGLVIRNAREITIATTRFRHWHRGLVVTQSHGITVLQNDISEIRSDGLNFAEVQDVRISRNRIHGFLRDLSSSDHADMIQFWTRGTDTPSARIRITDNDLNADPGWYTQSIFMRNEVIDANPDRTDMAYRDVIIEGNRIHNAHLHGITVGQSVGLSVRGNILTFARSAAAPEFSRRHATPSIQIHPASRNVDVSGNLLDAGAARHWVRGD